MVAGLAVAIIATPTCKATRAAIERKEAKGEGTVGNGRDAPVANGHFLLLWLRKDSGRHHDDVINTTDC